VGLLYLMSMLPPKTKDAIKRTKPIVLQYQGGLMDKSWNNIKELAATDDPITITTVTCVTLHPFFCPNENGPSDKLTCVRCRYIFDYIQRHSSLVFVAVFLSSVDTESCWSYLKSSPNGTMKEICDTYFSAKCRVA